ncbi:MAG: FtsK/SpoIIIE domain-containing protein [Microbacteriaceae bacterium]|nr:FtsK/SpoIIIE domain-containing protein [Microbacteriaceae bacterium]
MLRGLPLRLVTETGAWIAVRVSVAAEVSVAAVAACFAQLLREAAIAGGGLPEDAVQAIVADAERGVVVSYDGDSGDADKAEAGLLRERSNRAVFGEMTLAVWEGGRWCRLAPADKFASAGVVAAAAVRVVAAGVESLGAAGKVAAGFAGELGAGGDSAAGLAGSGIVGVAGVAGVASLGADAGKYAAGRGRSMAAGGVAVEPPRARQKAEPFVEVTPLAYAAPAPPQLVYKLELPAAPQTQKRKLPLVPMFLPVVFSGVMFAVTRQPLLLMFAFLSPLMLLSSWLESGGQQRRAALEQRMQALTKVDGFLARVCAAARRWRARQQDCLPAPTTRLGWLSQHATQSSSARLWAGGVRSDQLRVTADKNSAAKWGSASVLHASAAIGSDTSNAAAQPGLLRLGVAPAAAPVQLEMPDLQQLNVKLMAAARQAHDVMAQVSDVPQTLPLSGTFAIIGEIHKTMQILQAVLLQLITDYPPERLNLHCDNSLLLRQWLELLPHWQQNFQENTRETSLNSVKHLVGNSSHAPYSLSPAGERSVEAPVLSGREAHQNTLIEPKINIQIILASRQLNSCTNRENGAADFSIVLCENAMFVPANATAVLTATGKNELWQLSTKTSENFGEIGFKNTEIVPDLLDEASFKQAVLCCAKLRRKGAQTNLPNRTETGWCGTHSLENSDFTRQISAAWQNPASEPGFALLSDGNPQQLNLRALGPHILLAGTTGSGKSELMQSILLALAVRCSPQNLALLLVDFKGGASFGQITQLPHCVGLVTDLDSAALTRMLQLLRAEMRRREELFAENGVTDITECRKKLGASTPPFLVVAIDEYAALVQELPEAAASFADIAQRGRSLGIYLILATQRPGGSVSEKIRANIALQLVLRTATAQDSTEILGKPWSADIPPHAAGHGFMRVGGGQPRAFQAVSANVPNSAVEPMVEVHGAGLSVQLQDETGTSQSETVMQQIVQAMRHTVTAERLRLRYKIWLPQLPAQLAQNELSRGGWAILDLPDRQKQQVLLADTAQNGITLCGAPGSGKTNALHALQNTCKNAVFIDGAENVSRRQLMRDIFNALMQLETAATAETAPAIFFDNYDIAAEVVANGDRELGEAVAALAEMSRAKNAAVAVTLTRAQHATDKLCAHNHTTLILQQKQAHHALNLLPQELMKFATGLQTLPPGRALHAGIGAFLQIAQAEASTETAAKTVPQKDIQSIQKGGDEKMASIIGTCLRTGQKISAPTSGIAVISGTQSKKLHQQFNEIVTASATAKTKKYGKKIYTQQIKNHDAKNAPDVTQIIAIADPENYTPENLKVNRLTTQDNIQNLTQQLKTDPTPQTIAIPDLVWAEENNLLGQIAQLIAACRGTAHLILLLHHPENMLHWSMRRGIDNPDWLLCPGANQHNTSHPLLPLQLLRYETLHQNEAALIIASDANPAPPYPGQLNKSPHALRWIQLADTKERKNND